MECQGSRHQIQLLAHPGFDRGAGTRGAYQVERVQDGTPAGTMGSHQDQGERGSQEASRDVVPWRSIVALAEPGRTHL